MSQVSTRRYAGRSADERDADRHSRLLAAALDVVGTLGYAGTTVERICTAASVSTRHFYRQYESKDAAVADLYGSLIDSCYAAASAALAASADRPTARRIPDTLLAYVHPMLHDPRVARVLLIEITAVTPELERMRLGYRDDLQEFIAQHCRAAAQRGEIADRDFSFAALALIGAIVATVSHWARHADRANVPRLERALGDLAMTLLTS